MPQELVSIRIDRMNIYDLRRLYNLCTQWIKQTDNYMIHMYDKILNELLRRDQLSFFDYVHMIIHRLTGKYELDISDKKINNKQV